MSKLDEGTVLWLKKWAGTLTEKEQRISYKGLFPYKDIDKNLIGVKFSNISSDGGEFKIFKEDEMLANGSLRIELYESAKSSQQHLDHVNSVPTNEDEYFYKITLKDKDGDYHQTSGRYNLATKDILDYGYKKRTMRDIENVTPLILGKWAEEVG